jgi:tripartite-type tricarboxylate transporter receptor subunit TctC
MVMRMLLSLLLACLLASPAQAQSGKVTRIFVGFPAGQATDIVARLLAERLGPALGETVIVENRPGQGGSLVLTQLARMPADGTNMALAPLASMVVNPHLYKNVGYDSLKDLEHVALVADLPLLLVANASLPVKTLPELIAYAKANPDKLAHSSSGIGTLSHLGMEDLKRRAGSFRLSAWLGIVLPAGTPKARVERLSAELVKIVQAADIAQKYANVGALPRSLGADEFGPFVQAEHARWGAIVKASGVKVD